MAKWMVNKLYTNDLQISKMQLISKQLLGFKWLDHLRVPTCIYLLILPLPLKACNLHDKTTALYLMYPRTPACLHWIVLDQILLILINKLMKTSIQLYFI